MTTCGHPTKTFYRFHESGLALGDADDAREFRRWMDYLTSPDYELSWVAAAALRHALFSSQSRPTEHCHDLEQISFNSREPYW